MNYSRRWHQKRFRTEDVIELLQRGELRWGESPQAVRAARRVLRRPDDSQAQSRFAKKLNERLRAFAASMNPAFHGNYPSPGSLPRVERKQIPLALLPTGDWLSISLEAVKRNVVVCGSTGAGKSNVLKGTIASIVDGGGTVIGFDKKGKGELIDCESSSKLPVHVWHWSELRVAPLQPIDGIPLNYWANVVVSLLSSQWSLIASTTLMMELVHEFYNSPGSKTWDALVGKAVSFKPESFRSQQYRDVLIRNLKSVLFSFGEVINYEESNMLELMSQSKGCCHVILTDGLPPEHANLLASLFLVRDYEYRRTHEEAQKQVTAYVLDDSMELTREGRGVGEEGTAISPLNSIAFMGRSLGLGLIISAQNFSKVSDFFTHNADTIVCCGSSGEDAYQLQRHMNLTDEQAEYMSRVRPGELVVLARSEWPYAVAGWYPLIE